MQPVEIKKNIFWVGALDWDIRDFHGYSTYKGTTYNAYLVIDEKITLFDTVKAKFKNQLLDNIAKIIDPAKIDYVVVNHVEMDHSGALPTIMEVARPEKIICSAMGKKALLAHFHRDDWPYREVGSGDALSLGARTVHFLETRMLHWPDSMFSYIPEEKLLISSDAFGQHWATSERFDDQVETGELMRHAAKYYANILLLYSKLVPKLVDKVEDLGLAIDMIAPDHGLIWRKEPGKIIRAYLDWSAQKPQKKALIIYDTMWESTRRMGEALAIGLDRAGVAVKMLDLGVNHRSDVVTEVLNAKGLLFGSPTLNNGMLPRLADILTYLKGLKPENKIGLAFGSYGWSGEAVGHITKALEEMKIEVAHPGLKVKYVPTDADLQACIEAGLKVGRAIVESVG